MADTGAARADDTGRLLKSPQNDAVRAVAVGSTVFGACLLGILTRPDVELLASVWPANALLLGMFVRWPGLARPLCWGAACAGYFAADLVTGSPIQKTLLLSAANLAGVVAGWLLFRCLRAMDGHLRHPRDVLYLALISFGAAAISGVVGMVVNPILFRGMAADGWMFWFATESVNYICFLPAILSVPERGVFRTFAVPRGKALRRVAPALSLFVSCAAALVIEGPGAIAFPVPALLWCALEYRTFFVALLTLGVGFWMLIEIGDMNLFIGGAVGEPSTAISIRMGLALLSLAPINVAVVMGDRREAHRHLERLANHDPLTGLLNRSAFVGRSNEVLGSGDGVGPCSVMMLDLDHFKTINDRYGHMAGDEVLERFGAVLRQSIRDGDLAGRLGGEEFAVLLVDCDLATALTVAERIRSAFAATDFIVDDGRTLRATVTIGVAAAGREDREIGTLLLEADRLLYKAKQAGRNRVGIVADM